MAFTEKVRGTYGFHEQTLSDRVYPITNTTTRKLVQNELVIFGGVFGNVIELAGIAGSGKGLVNINPERTIKTEQLASGATFSAGGVVYIVDGTNSAPAGLTHTDNGEKNTPVGLVVEIDPATPQRYVVMRPYVQLASTGTISAEVKGTGYTSGTLKSHEDRLDTLEGTGAGSVAKAIADLAGAGRTTETVKGNADAIALRELSANKVTAFQETPDDTHYPSEKLVDDSLEAIKGVDYTDGTLKSHEDRLDTLEGTGEGSVAKAIDDAVADAVKMITLEVDGDATTPIELGLDNIGLNVGDTIIDVIVTGAAVKTGGTVKIGHGDNGNDITDTIPAAAVGTVTHATEIVAGVLTNDGIVITANYAEVRAVIRVLYI